MKIRIFPESNYKAIFIEGKTIRFALDPKNKITELKYPEFYDIKLTDECQGKCPYCYQNSTPAGECYKNIAQKTKDFFAGMDKNQLPFQIALGGGEPTSHPEFYDVCKVLTDYGIQTSYTTNGMGIDNPKTIKATELCAGVAISTHPHLRNYWEKAIEFYSKFNKCLNLHVILSDKKSIDDFKEIYDKFEPKISFFVLLPLTAKGRCKEAPEVEWEYFKEVTKSMKIEKLAFGARFYPYLTRGNNKFHVSLYEPEIMSKFLDLKDMRIYGSSFELEG